jgi:sugar phosphate isomerase/epimerase
MLSLHRRSFIKGLVFTAAGTAFASGPQVHFPTDPRSRIGVATYPFRDFLETPRHLDRKAGKPSMDLKAFAKLIPREFGVHGIEPLDAHFASTDAEYIRGLRAAFDAVGVRTINIPIDGDPHLCSQDAELRKKGLAQHCRWIDAAVILGSPSVRMHIPRCPDILDLDLAAKAFAPVIQYAAANNVIVNLENDDPVLDGAYRIISFIEKVKSPWLRALPDFGNSMLQGDAEFNAKAVEGMFRLATSIAHVKDAETIRDKTERADIKRLFGIAKAANFKGFYSMESDYDTDPFKDTKHLIELSVALM